MKLIAGLICFFASFMAVAQTTTISNQYKLPPKTNKFKVIGKNNDGIIVRLYGTDDVIDVFDETLKLTASRTIDFKNQTGLLQYIMLNKTGAVIFYLQQDKKQSVLFAQPVNSKFIEIGKPIAIDSIVDRRELISSNLRFKPSVDQSQLMIYYPYFTGSKLESVKFICVDRSLQLLYNKTVVMNRDERELEESKPIVDNNGNAYLILKPETQFEGSQYDVFRVGSNGDIKTYSIVTDKALFGEPAFDIDNKNGNLVMCAFYNDNKRAEDVANGFMFASFDPANGTPVKVNYTPFSKQFIAELTGREPNEKGRLYTFSIRKSLLRNDGGAAFVAESFIKDTHETPVAAGFQPGYTNYRTSIILQFNDIIAFSINARGEMEWHSVMRKKQASEDDNGVYSSFLTMNEKDDLRFLYLDDISTSGALTQYVLTSDGKSSRNVLFNQEEKEVMLLAKMGKQVAPDEVIIPSYLNGMLRLVRITF
jgi:hypothetical protein